MNEIVFVVGLVGPLVVYGVASTFDFVMSLLEPSPRHDEADDLADADWDSPPSWWLAFVCAGALAVADPIVAAGLFHSPLGILARIALGGAMAGLVIGRVLVIANGALMLVAAVWPVALVLGAAIHIGALWIALQAL